MNHSRSWLDGVLGGTLTIVLIALLLHWASDLLRPLVPIMAVVVVLGVLVTAAVRLGRNRYW